MSIVDLVVIALPTGKGTVSGPGGTTPVGFCTALFAPRLRLDGTINAYGPDWKSWPNALAARSLQVRIDGVVRPSQVLSTPSQTMWRAVFPTSTPVRRHVYIDRQTTELASFAAATLDQQLRDLYHAVAEAHPLDPPTADEIGTMPEAVVLASDDLADAQALAEPHGDGEPAEPDDPEFHDWLGLLASHPALMRQLGLLVDLRVDLTGVASASRLQIEIDYAALPNRRSVSPATRLTTAFRSLADPDPDRNELLDGWLRCGDRRYGVAQVDAIENALMLRSVEEGHGAGVPVQRFAGVSLVRDDHEALVAGRIVRSAEVELQIEKAFEGAVSSPPDLFAEDLTSGYRFEVRDSTSGTWRSLVQRTPRGPYDLPRNGAVSFTPPADEGEVTLVLTGEGLETVTSSNGFGGVGEEGPKHPHENRAGSFRADPFLVSWYGWSLAVPRPQSVLDATAGTGVPAPVPTPGTGAVRLAIRHDVTPGTLPKLRFGHQYEFRARAVDLGGGSLPFLPGGANPAGTTSPVERFGRTEVVDSPFVVRRTPRPDPGTFDTPLTIVLKSDYDTPNATVATQERMLFPPAVGQYTCELHDLPGGGADPTAHADLKARDASSVEAMGSRDPSTGDLLFTGSAQAVVSYLADPAGAGVAFAGVPGSTGSVTVPWTVVTAWPKVRAGRVIVKAGNAGSTVRPTADTLLRISIPKATDQVVQVSSAIAEAMLGRFDHYDELLPAAQSSIHDLVRDGQHWMFSGRTELHLVHAVRRPLARPQLLGFTAGRSLGGTDAALTGPVALDAASTGTLTAVGRWVESTDDPDEPSGPTGRDRATRSSAPIARGSDEPAVPLVFPFGTTRRVEVTVEADAISRFVDYFTERVDRTLTGVVPASLSSAGVVASTVVVTKANGTVAEEGVAYELDEAAGTIRRISGGGIPGGSTVSVSFVARPVSRSSLESADGATATTVVPASVAPPPPALHELTPSALGSTTATVTKVTRRRLGRSLRVWLDRPWLASGDGEMLAVVTSASVIGRDPLAAAADGPEPLTPTSVATATVRIDDLDGTGRTVAAQAVQFDEGRGRWFTDLRFTGDIGYRPWVRLALARYQPDALVGTHLSVPVEAAEVRLGVDRTVTVTKAANHRVVVKVVGEDHLGIDGRTNQITAVVQRADPVITDPDLRWVDLAAESTLNRTALGTWQRTLSYAATSDPLRVLLIEREPAVIDPGATDGTLPIYVETVVIPSAWTS